jgi:hypothetical protein
MHIQHFETNKQAALLRAARALLGVQQEVVSNWVSEWRTQSKMQCSPHDMTYALSFHRILPENVHHSLREHNRTFHNKAGR